MQANRGKNSEFSFETLILDGWWLGPVLFQFPFCNSRRSTCVLAKKIMRDLIILCKNIMVGPYLTLFSKRLLSWLIQVAYFDMIISHQKRRNLRLAKKVRKSLKKIMVFARLPKNENNSLSWVKKMLRIVSFVRFLGKLRTPKIAFEIY